MADTKTVSLQYFRWWVCGAFVVVVFVIGYFLLSRVFYNTSTSDEAMQAWLTFLFSMGLPIAAYIVANVRIIKSRRRVHCLQAIMWYVTLVVFCAATIYAEYKMLHGTKVMPVSIEGFNTKIEAVTYNVKEATDFVCGWFGPILTALLFVDIFASPLNSK